MGERTEAESQRAEDGGQRTEGSPRKATADNRCLRAALGRRPRNRGSAAASCARMNGAQAPGRKRIASPGLTSRTSLVDFHFRPALPGSKFPDVFRPLVHDAAWVFRDLPPVSAGLPGRKALSCWTRCALARSEEAGEWSGADPRRDMRAPEASRSRGIPRRNRTTKSGKN